MAEQQEIPGTERPKIKEIERAASKYVQVRDERMALTKKEVTAKQALIDTFLQHAEKITPNSAGERIYVFGDEMVILKPGKPKVKVTTAPTPGDGEGEED